MANTANDTDILIAGAGPVGLFLANECGRRGLRWRLIEEHSSQSEHSKALAIFSRTLEIFDMAGVVGPFLENANRVTLVAVVTQERTLARMRFEPQETPYSFVAMVPQNITERLLVQELQHKGGTVEYGTRFVSADQDGDRVIVTVDRNGELSKLTASFVVGCDGAHSQVRRTLNLPFEGGEYDAAFMLADIEAKTTLPADELQLCPSEFGPVAIFPISAGRRLVAPALKYCTDNAAMIALAGSYRLIRGERDELSIDAEANLAL